MIQLAPHYCVPRFELSVYEDVNSRTDTNDTVIYRITADTKTQMEKIIENTKKNYPGFKYRMHDYKYNTDTIEIF